MHFIITWGFQCCSQSHFPTFPHQHHVIKIFKHPEKLEDLYSERPHARCIDGSAHSLFSALPPATCPPPAPGTCSRHLLPPVHTCLCSLSSPPEALSCISSEERWFFCLAGPGRRTQPCPGASDLFCSLTLLETILRN